MEERIGNIEEIVQYWRTSADHDASFGNKRQQLGLVHGTFAFGKIAQSTLR